LEEQRNTDTNANANLSVHVTGVTYDVDRKEDG